jgi:hypothetical protein
MAIYYIILTAIFIASISPKHIARSVYWPIFGFLFLFAALRSSSVDQDYLGYLDYYYDAISGIFWNVEPSFLLIARFIDALSLNARWLFIIYDLLGLLILGIAISRIETDRLTVTMFFFSGHFLLWPMTQIRVGLAGAIFLLSLVYLAKNKRVVYIVAVASALFFHYLSVVLYILVPINDKTKSAWRMSLLIPISVFIYYTGFSIATISDFVPIELIALKLQTYEEQKTFDNNVFNFLLIARLFLALSLLSMQRKLMHVSTYFGILLKVYIVAIFLHIAFGWSPLASRASELLLIVEPILIVISSRLMTNRFLSRLVVFIASILYLSFNLFYVKLLNPYDISLFV